MDPFEVKLVRQYAINEIAGGLMLGSFVLKSENPYLRSQLTYHAMDELKHGWLWTEFLDKQKIGVANAKGGNEYFDFIAAQEDEMMFLVAVHIYELRVPFHLSAHIELPQINPELKEVMGKIRDDEKFHLSWVREYLDTQDHQSVLNAVKKCEQIEEDAYSKYIHHIKQYGGYLADLAALIEKKKLKLPRPSDVFAARSQNA